MNRFRTIRIALLFLLLLSGLAARNDAALQCQGRTCGTVFGYCCACAEHGQVMHGLSHLPVTRGTVFTSAECCAFSLHPFDIATAAAGLTRTTAPLHPACLLPRVLGPLPSDVAVWTIELFGPPLPCLSQRSLSPRAPPFI